MPIFAKINASDIQKSAMKRQTQIEKDIAPFKKIMREAGYSMEEILEAVEHPTVRKIAQDSRISDEKRVEMFNRFLKRRAEKAEKDV